jgi:hypothetical protein
MINTVLRNTFNEKFPEISLQHINLLTFKVEDVTYLKVWSCTSPENYRSTRACVTLVQQNRCTNFLMPNYEDIENILIERWEEERMAHIQHETLQMLCFKEASFQLEADTYATLPLVLPI